MSKFGVFACLLEMRDSIGAETGFEVNNNQYTAEKIVWRIGAVILSGFLYSTKEGGRITVSP
ncbi:hypothetical protein [Desulfomarina sp.]